MRGNCLLVFFFFLLYGSLVLFFSIVPSLVALVFLFPVPSNLGMVPDGSPSEAVCEFFPCEIRDALVSTRTYTHMSICILVLPFPPLCVLSAVSGLSQWMRTLFHSVHV